MVSKTSNNDEKPTHPLLRTASNIDNFIAKREAADKQEDLLKEELEDWRVSINRLAATSDGQYFLKNMVKWSGFGKTPNTANTVKMVEDAGKVAFYLTYIRPYLDKDLRATIE